MKTVNIHRAKTELSKLLAEVERGEEVTIARAGRPIAKLVPIRERRGIIFGKDQGKIWMAPDFDEWTPELEADFFGGPDLELPDAPKT